MPIGYKNIDAVREYALSAHPDERHFSEVVQSGDSFSIINCCGDYQFSSKHVWNTIRAFEESLIYPLYA